jgi:hypothetical protein
MHKQRVSERYYEPASYLLLTGAGFSKPFGGYLAREIWSRLFNELDHVSYPSLKEFMKTPDPHGDLNYETIYDSVLKSRLEHQKTLKNQLPSIEGS